MKNKNLIDELFEAFDRSFKDDKEDQRIMLRIYSEDEPERDEDETYATTHNIKGFLEFHLPKIISKVIGEMEEVSELPFVAYGNEELAVKKPIGTHVICKNCGKKHKVEYGTTNGVENKMLGFTNCGKKTFMVSLNGKEL